MRLQQKCAVQKNRKFSISAEMHPSAAAAHVKHSSCELALKDALKDVTSEFNNIFTNLGAISSNFSNS